MSRIRTRIIATTAAVLISVTVVGATAPVASAATQGKPSKAILKAIL